MAKKGVDYNFYKKISVTATDFGGHSLDGYGADCVLVFTNTGLTLLNEGTGVVEYRKYYKRN